MARVLFVMMLLLAHNVFANEEDKNKNCDVCIRSGGKWCRSNDAGKHCITSFSDDACPNNDVEKLTDKTSNTDGDILRPQVAERTLYINDVQHRRMTVTYTSSVKRNVSVSLSNPNKIDVNDPKIDIQVRENECNATHCTVNIYAKPSIDFCSHFDFVDVVVNVDGFIDVAKIRYHVPCSCECSKKIDIKSNRCNNHGNFTCGTCNCENEWSGNNCEQSCTRGDQDLEECKNIKNDKEVVCSGNGKCACGKCMCFESQVGSQYFHPEFCADVCMQTIDCDACLRNATLGDCQQCDSRSAVLTVIQLNETIATTEKDEINRKVWVHCQEQKNDCIYNYYAMATEDQYYVMIKSNCNNVTSDKVVVATGSNVPVIIGVLGLVAVVATVGGILLWKHMNSLPPLPTADPQYANIDAEDCTGENPLYKPPTSSFKNPTYGKW